ncbi:MAG: glycosyltransferase [Kiritimatiellia bacterium]
MKILWCGPYFSDAALNEKRATNQAAAKWSRGLLRGLAATGCEIRVIAHCPEQRWPRGKVFWQNDAAKWFLDWHPCARIAYCNAYGIKDLWLSWAYARTARRTFRAWRPDVVLCYNSLHPFYVAVMREASRLGIRSVPIILDGDDPRGDNWKKLLADNRFAAGVVFLSNWMYGNYPNRTIPLFQMDGGADSFKGAPPTSAPTPKSYTYTLVHTGALDYWRGLEFMQGVVKACVRSDVRFVFCGKCDKDWMWAQFGNDPRVDVRGFLPAEEVDAICRGADVLLSVREPKVADNVVNYPSKVPQYLAWGKPIISTWVPSFTEAYREILEVSDDTPESFSRKIDEVLAWTFEKKITKFEQIRAWFSENKSWSRQAERLVAFLKTI